MKGMQQIPIKEDFTEQELGVTEQSERDFLISVFKMYKELKKEWIP